MGTPASTFFQMMLGWIRALSSEVWSTVTAPQGTTLIEWIGAHWKVLALALCVAGALIDLGVYLFRWQPFRVWRSFIHRMRNAREAKTDEEREFLFQDRPEIPEADGEKLREEDEIPSEMNDPPGEEFIRERPEPEGTTSAFEQAILPRRRRVTRLFAEKGEDTVTPDQLIDRYAAYRRPVYPRSWKTDKGDSEDEE